MLNLAFGNFKSIFQRMHLFISSNIFSHFKHISLLGFNKLPFNIWRQKHNSIRSSHLKSLPQNYESQ